MNEDLYYNKITQVTKIKNFKRETKAKGPETKFNIDSGFNFITR